MLYRKTVDPEMQDLVKSLRDRELIPLKPVEKLSVNNNLS